MQQPKLILTGLVILFASVMQAQVSVNVNIGGLPPWGPQVEADIRYYYLPNVQAYYDINRSSFVYFCDGNWVHRRHLPARYKHYDLYRGRKIVVHDYYGNYPYSHCNYHKARDNRNYYYRGRSGGSEYYERNYRDHHWKNGNNGHGEGKNKFARGNGNGHKKQKDWKD
ncbi:MAG: hypothetical protein QM800_00110 [Paludibacter sp.]